MPTLIEKIDRLILLIERMVDSERLGEDDGKALLAAAEEAKRSLDEPNFDNARALVAATDTKGKNIQ